MEVEVVENFHRLIVKPSRSWVPIHMQEALLAVEELASVSVDLVAEEQSLVYKVEVGSDQNVECVAELVRGRLEYLEGVLKWRPFERTR